MSFLQFLRRASPAFLRASVACGLFSASPEVRPGPRLREGVAEGMETGERATAAGEPAAAAMEEDPDDPYVLGFAEPPEDARALRRHRFPSKLGGRPAWLDPCATPGGAAARCGHCGGGLRFLLQLYCPVGDAPHAFHRALFVFVCPRGACAGRPGAARAFRSQMARANPFYPPTTCHPCLCDSEHALQDCEVPSLIESGNNLNLRGKGIKRIEKGAFDFEGLGKIEWMHFDGNALEVIEAGTFKQMANLEWLELQNNALEVIEAGAFEDLGNLGSLDLWGNELTCSSACGTCGDYSCCDNGTTCGW